jgi:hypothetical protein
MRVEVKNMIKKLQVKFSKDNEKLTYNIKNSTRRFIKEATAGIIKSQSCIVRRIAQEQHEEIDLKKTQERFTYQLDNEKEIEKFKENMLIQGSRKLDNQSLILVDPSDITKKRAVKMEGICCVRDGNDGSRKSGYNVIDIVGVNRDSDSYSVSPLYSEIHSEEIGSATMKNKLFDALLDIIIHSNNSGTYVMDREFDDKKVIQELYNHMASFLIRMKKNRHVFYKNNLQNIAQVGKNIKHKYVYSVNSKTKIKAGVAEIGIPLSRHKVKNPETANVKLVSAEFITTHKNGRKTKGTLLLIISIPDRYLSDEDLCKFALESYRLRWKIEEVHRQVKVDFGWEDIQLMRFKRIQSLNTILWFTLGFIYSLDRWKYKFAAVFSSLMMNKKNNLKELEKFVYYRITKVVCHCFRMTRLYQKKNVSKSNNMSKQMLVPFFL